MSIRMNQIRSVFSIIWLIEKVLHNKTFAIDSNPKCDQYQHEFASTAYKFFDKKPRDTTTHAGIEIISEYQQLVNEFNRPITKQLCSSYRHTILGANFPEVELINK